MSGLDSGTILDILGNDTRRRILSILAQEPMYFNQLAKEVGVGQQAVLRHLQSLEDGGFINAYSEKSSLGAPDRKYYRLSTSFVLVVALSEDDFTIKNRKIEQTRQKESARLYRQFDSMYDDPSTALPNLRETLVAIDKEAEALEQRLNDLRALRQLVLKRLHEIGMDKFEQEERRVLYKIVEKSPENIAELSDLVDRKESDVRAIVSKMDKKVERDSRPLFDLD
jgi:ArsR family transcriptional regulator